MTLRAAAAAVAAVAAAAVFVATLDGKVDALTLEFREPVVFAANLTIFALLVGVGFVCWGLVHPVARRLMTRAPDRAPQRLVAARLFVAALLGMSPLHRGLAPIHISGPAPLFMDAHAPYVPISKGAFPRPEGSAYERGVASTLCGRCHGSSTTCGAPHEERTPWCC